MAAEQDPPPWDAGLQNERTGLAWQRTMLSGLACGLLVARALADVSPVLAIATGVGALGATTAFGWVALQRFRLNARTLTDRGRLDPDGRSPVLATVLLALTALAGIGYVLLA